MRRLIWQDDHRAHVAAASTRDSVELAKHAESLGVDALAAIPVTSAYQTLIKDYWNVIDATELDFIIITFHNCQAML